MKKLIKWIMGIIITLLVLIVIAAFVLPMVFDPNDHKDSIENTIQESIGRQVHLNGEIQWSVFPWLALTFNDVKVDNEKGFKGDSLAAIQQLSARVKLLPLLSKNIEIGRVSIEDAEINLQITKKGNSNWQSILTSLDKNADDSAATDSDSNSMANLDIAGIILNNINLNYTDAQTNTRAQISQLNLNTGAIKSDEPVDINSSLHLLMPDTGLDVDITAAVLASNLLSGNGLKMDVNDFDITGKLSAESTLPLQIQLQEKGQIDLANDSLSFSGISISAGAAKINTNISGKNIQHDMQLSGSYQLSAFDLNALVKELTGSDIVTSGVLSDFSSSGTWSFGGKQLKLSDLLVHFDDTTVKGSANISNLDKMAGNFKLHINKLNVDDFLGDDNSSQQASNSSTSDGSDIKFGHLTGTIKIDTLVASGAKMDNISVQVKTNNSKMSLAPIKADFYKGLLVTEVQIDTKAQTNKVKVLHKMNKIHAGPLLTDLAGSEMLTGIGDLNIDLKIDQPFSELPLKSAHGNIKYQLDNGAIYGVDVFGMMKKGLSLIYPDLKQNADDGVKKTDFALMLIDADVDQGILTTNTLKIESPYLKVTGDVVIDLVNMTIDGTIEPMLLDIPEELVSDKYKKLLNLPIPVSLSGSLLEPDISIDAKKLLLSSQKERINKEKDKLKDKLMGSLFGKDKKESKPDDAEENTDKQDQAEDSEQGDEEQEPKKKESKEDKLKKKLKGLLGG
jgi:AsmA protein